MDGQHYCAAHTPYDRRRTDPLPAGCAVPDCPAESNRVVYGFPLCAGHGPGNLPERSF
jgi:hypothetical protein